MQELSWAWESTQDLQVVPLASMHGMCICTAVCAHPGHTAGAQSCCPPLWAEHPKLFGLSKPEIPLQHWDKLRETTGVAGKTHQSLKPKDHKAYKTAWAGIS